jgi:hypothetical protein
MTQHNPLQCLVDAMDGIACPVANGGIMLAVRQKGRSRCGRQSEGLQAGIGGEASAWIGRRGGPDQVQDSHGTCPGCCRSIVGSRICSAAAA